MYVDPNKIVPERSGEYSQDLCTIRANINFNDAGLAAGVWFATLPANAYILAIDAYVVTAFNAATTNVFTLGVTKANANEISASGTINPATLGVQHATAAAGLGLAVTGVLANQTAINGGVPVYAKYAQTGTAATAGVLTVVILFVKNNDR